MSDGGLRLACVCVAGRLGGSERVAAWLVGCSFRDLFACVLSWVEIYVAKNKQAIFSASDVTVHARK